MSTGTFRRILAIVMTLVCVFAYVVYEPASALAEQIRSDNELTENIDTINSIWENEPNVYSPLVGEMADEREEAVKRFRRADGATELVAYSSPVHFRMDDEWVAIDNTLKYDEKTGRFANTANDFTFEFAANEPVINIDYNGDVFSMTAVSIPGVTDTELNAVVSEREKKEDLTDEEKDELLRFPEELSSALEYYTEDGSKAGLEYKLSGKSLSEYVTVFEKPEEAPVYVYTFTTSLIPHKEENVIYFKNTEGEDVMYFSAPVMWDAEGNECFDFAVELAENEDGSYTYTLVPDEEWLLSDKRAYPVTVDPDVNVNFRGNVQNTYVSPSYPTTPLGSNQNTKYSLKVGGSDHYRTLLRLNSIDVLSPGDVIIEATISLSRYQTEYDQYGKEIDAFRMNGTWDESSLTWNEYSAINGGHPYDDSRIETLANSTYYDIKSVFDITDLYKKWYAGEIPNYGVMLTSDYYAVFYSSRNSVNASCHPYFSVVYVNSTGLESRFSYSSQSAGRAGTGSVNLYSGNLTMSFADAEITNGSMPISVSHVYNTNDSYDRPSEHFLADAGYGYGWRLNYAQTIEAISLQNRSETATYYEYIDGDGTRHYYKRETDTKYVNELDKDSVLTINRQSGILTITDKGDNKLVFECGYFDHDNNSSTQNEFTGHLVRIEDANGNKTLITYTSDSFNGSIYRNIRIASITEKLAGQSSSGQSITFTYSSGHLSSITVPNGLNRTYTYSSGDLTQVGSADSNTCYYTYSSHKITNVKNIDNYNLDYTYDDLKRVTSVQEKANTTEGNFLTYDYGWNVTTVTDKQDRSTIYQFNNSGQAVSVMDNEGNAVYAAYNTDEQTTTQLAAVSKVQHTIINLLKNSSFDDSNYGNWSVHGTNCTIYSGMPHTGRYSLKLQSGGYADQTVSVTAGSTYTLSAYFTGEEGGKVQVYNGSSLLAESDVTDLTVTPGSSWQRRYATFTVPSGVSSVTVRIAKVSGGSTNTYIDTVQLEEGNTPNRANLITNGDFSNGTTAYTTNGFQTGDGVVTCSDTTHPSYLSSSVLKIDGSMLNEFVKQTLYVTGKKGDTYSFGGWCASGSIPMSSQPNYNTGTYVLCGERSMTVTFYNGSTYVNKATLYFAADTTDWQFASSSAVAGGAYTKIEVSVRFCQSRNTAYYDGIQLYREEFSQGYEYDENGNLSNYTSLISQENDFQYDDDNNLTSAKDARVNTTTYTYDSKHNQLTATTPEGVVTTNVYDTNGNVTSTQVGSNTDYIRASTTYDSASALATAVTDARGNSVTYSYNSNTRQQTTVTDAKGNTSIYAYDNAAAMHRLVSLTSPTGYTGATATVEYGYDTDGYGKLTDITRDSTVYRFTYDVWGNVVDTKVGNITLSTNAYDEYGRLERVTYGNGFVTEYVYDELDRVSEIKQGTANNLVLNYKFIYNGEGDLYELRNYKTLRSTFFEYDHAGRCMASTEKEFEVTTDGIKYGDDPLSGYRYEYDANNNLSKLICRMGNEEEPSWATTYVYDMDNRPTEVLLDNGKKVVNSYDAIGRITSKALKNGNSTILNTTVTYISGADGSKTALVKTYKNGSDIEYRYDYDANGNINHIWRGNDYYTADVKFGYVYDNANQLIRENLYYGLNDPNNKTVRYYYDKWGNITQIKTYAYTTSSSLGTPVSTVTYGYTNSQWGDLLTSYDGNTITYDAMGNPTSYLGKTLTWEGKQLTSYANGSTSIAYAYNEDGLRLSKTVGTTKTEYYYNGSVLIGMKIGSGSTAKVLRFSYDASGNVVAVDYSTNNGSSFTTYYYVRNAQNDIVKLIDGSGNTVVEYTYDSWGKSISVTGTLATTLGADQPFRYRGYVYDTETEWYYLQSRYYDPTTCRFISADVYLSTGQGVIGHNSFAYCLNNPLIHHDPAGTWSRNNSDKSNVNDGGSGLFGTFTGWVRRTWTTYKASTVTNEVVNSNYSSHVTNVSASNTHHLFPKIVDNYVGAAKKFILPDGAHLYQIEGAYRGKIGRFEWIVDHGCVTHRFFVQGGRINGIPSKK